MKINEMQKIFDDVRIDGKYAYVCSLYDECVELYEISENQEDAHYIRDFNNIAACKEYVKGVENNDNC